MANQKISIALATFNGERYLEDQINSILQQNLRPHELIVCDDGSTDNTIQLIKQLTHSSPFPVLIEQNKKRLGYGRNFLKAASLCTGSIIAFCDQDDFWLPEKVQRLHHAFTNYEVDFVAHTADVVTNSLVKTGTLYPNILKDQYFERYRIYKKFFPGFSITISQKLFGNLKPIIDSSTNIEAHDELICRIVETGWGRYEIAQSLVLYRQHERNLIGYHGAVLTDRAI
jgi:glycosyltransferase involved in cell wall biosynthesis